MSTLAEIELAAYRLPMREQEELLRHLAMKLRSQGAAEIPGSRERWMIRLDELRSEIGTGMQKVASERILSDLREERS